MLSDNSLWGEVRVARERKRNSNTPFLDPTSLLVLLTVTVVAVQPQTGAGVSAKSVENKEEKRKREGDSSPLPGASFSSHLSRKKGFLS